MLSFVILGLCMPLAATYKLRVVAGKDDKGNKYPYVVAVACPVHNNLIRTCTGSVISETWVLTASHCVSKAAMKKKGCVVEDCKVIYGDMKILPELSDTYRKILKAVSHHGSKIFLNKNIIGSGEDLLIRNDIALILIDKIDIKPGRVSAIDYKAVIGYPVSYVGAGGTFSNHDLQNRNAKLGMTFALDQVRPFQIGEGVVLSCNKKLKSIYFPAMCISSKCSTKVQKVQKGDSGAPVVYNGKITGVCISATRYWTVYVPLSPYLDWLTDVMASTKNT